MSAPLHLRKAVEIAAEVRDGKLLARDVAEHFLDRLRRYNPQIFAFVEVHESDLRAQADAVDAARRSGTTLGRLAGVPVGVKDVLCVRGMETTCGSKILRGYRPPYDATAVERLRAAGALLVPRANMDEFAMGSSTEHSSFGPTRNPWDTTRVPGGSSGGSAAAVAARLTSVSLGTDTGGSIRQPAALCGISGLKPTYGRVSRYGLIAFASSLDQIGPFATCLEDAATVTEVIAGNDSRDGTTVAAPAPNLTDALSRGVKGLRIGVPREWMADSLDAGVRASVEAAVDHWCSQGAQRVEVTLPRADLAIPTYYLVATAEASSNLARFDGVRFAYRAEGRNLEEMYGRTRDQGFGEEVKRRILLGTFVLSAGYSDAYYKKALQVRTLLKQDFERAFEKCDVIAGPASPFPAFEIGSKMDDPLAMYLCDLFTAAINLVGLPGISIPCGFAQGPKGPLPLGLQLVAPALREDSIFAAAGAFERATRWHQQVPKAFAS